eukprot:5880419-Alexandrium_andersonii.AAC.1
MLGIMLEMIRLRGDPLFKHAHRQQRMIDAAPPRACETSGFVELRRFARSDTFIPLPVGHVRAML